jgi:uncharacterized protein YqgV (UPF0045/DUF77 family)
MLKKSLLPTVILIGAFERDNLGDLLFPKIIGRFLSGYQTIYASIIGNDLTNIGGDIVYSLDSIRALSAKLNIVAIIHCGGETLACSSDFALKMDAPRLTFSNNNLLDFTNIRSYFSDITNPLAYVYSLQDLGLSSHVKVGFISVGGTSLATNIPSPELLMGLKKRLSKATTVVIRDNTTKTNLRQLVKLPTTLLPDIVTLLPITHQSSIDNATRSKYYRNFMPQGQYIVFQCNEETLTKLTVSEVANNLITIFKQHKLPIIIQPMGTSINHGSTQQLTTLIHQINSTNPEVNIRINLRRNIWLQIAIIINSQLNIGTSLHFRIISDIYNVPCITINNPKVLAYLKTWQKDQLRHLTNLSQLPELVTTLISDSAPSRTNKMIGISKQGVEHFFDSLGLSHQINQPKPRHLPLTLSRHLLSHENNLYKQKMFTRLATDKLHVIPSSEILSSKFYQYWKLYQKIKGFIKKNA